MSERFPMLVLLRVRRLGMRALALCALLLGSAALQAGWVDTDLDSAPQDTGPGRHRSTSEPPSSVELLVNLQSSNGRALGFGYGQQRTYGDGTWVDMGRSGYRSGQVVDPFLAPVPGGYLNNFGPALGGGSGQNAGLFGSAAIPAAAGFARSFGTNVGPTSVYTPPPTEAPTNEQAPVRRAPQATPQYSSASSPFEDFVRWMQENRITIIVAGVLLLGLVAFGSFATSTRR